MFFCCTDWYLGPSERPEHDGQPEGEDDQRVRFLVQPLSDRLHHTGTVPQRPQLEDRKRPTASSMLAQAGKLVVQ